MGSIKNNSVRNGETGNSKQQVNEKKLYIDMTKYVNWAGILKCDFCR